MSKRTEILRGLSREQRTRIVRGVIRGEVLRDPEEARVAVRLARSLLETRETRRGWRRVMHWIASACALSFVTAELVVYLHGHQGFTVPTWPAVVLSFYLFLHVYGFFATPRLQERYAQAERLNLQLVESAGLRVEEQEPGKDVPAAAGPERGTQCPPQTGPGV
jgi:hypothetical protein